MAAYDAEQERQAVEQARLARRDTALVEMGKARKVRDRLATAEAKRKQAEAARAKEAAAAKKATEAAVTREERWASVDRVRAQFDPTPSVHRDAVTAERDARRSAYHADLAEKQAKVAAEPPAPKHTSRPKAKKPPMPSELRSRIEREQADRKEAWYAARGRR